MSLVETRTTLFGGCRVNGLTQASAFSPAIRDISESGPSSSRVASIYIACIGVRERSTELCVQYSSSLIHPRSLRSYKVVFLFLFQSNSHQKKCAAENTGYVRRDVTWSAHSHPSQSCVWNCVDRLDNCLSRCPDSSPGSPLLGSDVHRGEGQCVLRTRHTQTQDFRPSRLLAAPQPHTATSPVANPFRKGHAASAR